MRLSVQERDPSCISLKNTRLKPNDPTGKMSAVSNLHGPNIIIRFTSVLYGKRSTSDETKVAKPAQPAPLVPMYSV